MFPTLAPEDVFAENLAAEVITSSLREVAEIDLQEEVVSVDAHEVGEAREKKNAVKLVPGFAIELESVRGVTEVLVREELLNVITEDLAAKVITSSLRELESASLVEDLASEAEKIIPGVTCELTGNAIELESEDPDVHESVKETLSDVPSEDDKQSNNAHGCTLEWETVDAVQPEIAVEFENVTAVTEICLQEEVVSVVAHEVGEAKKKNSAVKLVPEFAIELESVRGVTEVLVREELLNVIAEDLAAEVITNSLRELESASLIEDIASEAEKIIPGVTCELTGNVIELESEDPDVHESVKETLSDVPSEDDKQSNKAHECTLEWETVSAVQPEIAVEFENVTAVTESPHLQEEVVSVAAYEVGEAKNKNNNFKLAPEFAIELERVRGATDLPTQEELINVIAEDLVAEVITSSLRELESVTLVQDIVSEAEAIQAVPYELTDSVIELESGDPVMDKVSETSVDILIDNLSVRVEGSECMLEWETVGVIEPEMAVEFEGVAEVNDILVQDKIISGVVHELSAAEVKPDLPFEPQSITATNDIASEEGNSTIITRELVSTKRESAFSPECSVQMENDGDVSAISNEVAAAEVKTSCTLWRESSLDLKSAEMCAAECLDPNDDIIGKKTMPNREFELTCIAGKVNQHYVLNAKADEFVPSFSTASGIGTEKFAKQERGLAGQVDQHRHVLNPEADEFIPGFQATRAFETNVFGKLPLSIAGQGDQRHILNPDADIFIPCFHATGAIQTDDFGRPDFGITGGRLSLNAFAKDFVPADFQSRASASMIAPPEYDVAPTAPALSPRPVRPRRRARQSKNPSVLNHPQNLQPRVISAFYDPHQAQPSLFMGPSWSTSDRYNSG